jgi:hypothetical protein
MWEMGKQCLEVPFHEYTHEQLAAGKHLKERYRPRPIIPAGWDDAYVGLMQDCWATQPDKRPDFKGIVEELELIVQRLKDAATAGAAG